MNVKFKFSVDEVIIINKLLQEDYEVNFHSLNNEQKLEVSIGIVLSDIFDKKKRNLQKNFDLITISKKVSFLLKYHEAWALKKILVVRFPQLQNAYQRVIIEQSIAKIDQKIPDVNVTKTHLLS